METEEWKQLCELVREKYGEEAEKIVKDRPGLSKEDITNYDIFNKKIMDVIGYGGVNSFITYDMSSSKVISALVRDDELLNAYKEFERMTGNFYPDSAIGLDDRLNAFYNNKDLVLEIIRTNRQEELKNNLLLMLRDNEYIFSREFDEEFIREQGVMIQTHLSEEIKSKLNVSSAEELGSYDKKRQKILDEIIEDDNKDLTYGKIKEIIKMKYFGQIDDSGGKYNKYNHNKFLSDYLKFNESELSEDEVDLVEVYSLLEKVEDIDTLKRLNKMLSSKNLNPVRMKEIDRKVVENYKKEYVDSLLTTQEMQQKVADTNDKSYLSCIYKKNGDTVYNDHRTQKDGTEVYEDYIVQRDKTKITQYKSSDEECSMIRKIEKSSGAIVLIEYTYRGINNRIGIENGKITDLDYGNEHEKIKISKDEQGHRVYTYRVYSQDGKKYSEYEWNEDGWYKESYGSGICRTVDVISNKELSNNIVRRDKRKQLNEYFIRAQELEENYEQIIFDWVKALEKSKPEQQFDKEKEMIIEEGDIPNYFIYDVDPRKLCISIQRGVTSLYLKEHRIIKRVVDEKGHYKQGELSSLIKIERFLEGGVPTRSCYYRCEPYSKKHIAIEVGTTSAIGIGMSSFDPNEILGFKMADGSTTHAMKQLRPTMDSNPISDILDGKKTDYKQAEVALHRYKYNIKDIKEGENGGKIPPTYIYNSGNKLAEEWGRAFNVPVVEFGYSSPEKKKELEEKIKESLLDERKPMRERIRGQIVSDVVDVIERSAQKEKNDTNYNQSHTSEDNAQHEKTESDSSKSISQTLTGIEEQQSQVISDGSSIDSIGLEDEKTTDNNIGNNKPDVIGEEKYAQIYKKSKGRISEVFAKIKAIINSKMNKQEDKSNEQYK